MKEEEKAIKLLEWVQINKLYIDTHNNCDYHEIHNAIQTVLNLIETQKAEIEKRDRTMKKIIDRLENDIGNITKTKSDGYTDDYRRCRLQAYRTKTREIKEYIEKEYFTKLAEEEK